jgi:Inner membrane protein YgaP-like, transmembrane domain
MRMDYVIRGIAGTFVLVSLALAQWISPWWLLFTAFVGLNLLQSSFTKWCLMEIIVEKLGVARRERPDGSGYAAHADPPGSG